MQNATQADRIIAYMEEFGSITQLEAMRDLGVMRLASRISDLKKSGYPIKYERDIVKNRYGQNVCIMRYSLMGG